MPAPRIAGYAATFGDPDAQADVIDPGAFAQSLRRRRHRLPLLWQHTMTEPLGRVLAAREDGHGLWFEAAMAATRRAADATALLRQGALRECSIGFVPRQVRFEARNGATVRHIQQLDLIENQPRYPRRQPRRPHPPHRRPSPRNGPAPLPLRRPPPAPSRRPRLTPTDPHPPPQPRSAGDRRAADALTDPNAGAPGAGASAAAATLDALHTDSTGLYRKAFETYVHHGERTVLALGAAYIKALTEGADSEGGHLVPIDWQAQILQAAGARAGLRAQVTAIPTSRDAVEWPIIEGADDIHASAVRRTWVDERPAEGAANTEPTFGAIRIPVHTAMLTTKASRNLVEDSAVPFTQILAGLFADEVRLSDEQAIIVGDGVGKPLGLLNTAGVPTVNSGHASQVTADGLLDLFYGLPAQYRDNAVFVMSSATEDALRKLKDTNNQYLWVGGFAATPETVLGRTVLSSEFMPAIAAATTPIAFGDFSRYVVVDRVGFTVQRIDGDQQLAEKNQIGFVGRQRVGGRVTQPRAFRLQTISA